MSYNLLSKRDVYAKKRHFCSWCGEPIFMGMVYCRESGVFDGEFNCQKFHIECSEARDETELDLEEGYHEGMFRRGTDEEK